MMYINFADSQLQSVLVVIFANYILLAETTQWRFCEALSYFLSYTSIALSFSLLRLIYMMSII